MRWEYQMLAIVGFSLFFIIIGILTSWIHPIPINVFHLIGMVAIPGCLAVFMGWYVMKGFTPPLLTYGRSYRFNNDELYTFTWKNDFIKDLDDQLLQMAALCLNGINYKGFNPKSPSNEPILYCLYEDIEQVGDGTVIRSIPRPTPKSKKPPYFRHWSKEFLKGRYNKCPSFICCYLSKLRADANGINEGIIFKMESEFEYATDIEEQVTKYRTMLKHDKILKQPTVINTHQSAGDES